MVSQTLQRTVDALSADDQADLLEYLQRTTGNSGWELTDQQLALISSRDQEMDADPMVGIPGDQFVGDLRSVWT